MEDIRAIARAYYDIATKRERDLVEQYFNKFNINGDGKITLQQYKNGVAKSFSDEKIFRKLDANGDGTLDFDEIVCLYYMEKKLGLHKCAACQDILVGAYFSCLSCVEDGLDFECRLCCACYRMGEFSHNHSLSNFLDQHSMAEVMKNHTPDARRDRGKAKSPMPSNSQATLGTPIPSNTQAKSLVASNSQATGSPIPSNTQTKSLVPSNSQATRSPIPSNTLAKCLVPSNTLATRSPIPSNTTTVPAANYNVVYNTYILNPPPVTNYYNAVIRQPNQNHWGLALKALQAALAIATAGSMCTTL